MLAGARKWLLWSPANFWAGVSGAVIAVIVIAVAWGFVLPDHPATHHAAATHKTGVGGFVLTDPTPTPTVAVTTEAQRMITVASQNFVATWLDTTPGWWSRVKPLIVPALRPSMKTTNLDNIPVTGVSSVKIVDQSKYNATTEVSLIDNSVLTVVLTWDGKHDWQIVSLLPKDADAEQ